MIRRNTTWVFIFQFLKILNGLIPVLLIPLYLSHEDQGLWFLMLSFGSIVLLFSAAQNGIVLIFGAHEFKNLLIEKLTIIGHIKDKNSLLAFTRYSKKFFIIFLTCLSLAVFLFFSFYIQHNTPLLIHTDLIMIFGMYLLGIFLFTLNFSFLSYLESFNQVLLAYKIKSFLMLAIICLTCLLLYLHYGLYALSYSIFISMLIAFGALYMKYKTIIMESFRTRALFNKHKQKIFVNYFQKNTFSMISGFLLFQVYTPIVYYFKGSVIAGKVGLSIAILSALFAVSIAPLNAKMASIIRMIAAKKYQESYILYFKVSQLALIIFLFLGSLGAFLLFKIDIFYIYKERVVDFFSFMLLWLAWLFQVIVYIFVTYIRCFKRELFIIPTVISAFYILITTIITLHYDLVDYIFVGFLSSYVFGLPWIYVIYRKFLASKGALK